MSGILWAIAHKRQYNIRVLNLSIGSDPVAPTDFDPIAQAVELAWKSGITVVCAAGNEGETGPGGILSPGDSPYVITVGAADTRQTPSTSDDTVTYYSSVGPTLWDEYAKPDLLAPGNRLISLRVPGSYIDTNFPQNLIAVSSYVPGAPDSADPSYLMLSGTSTSAPVDAGVAALMIGQNPGLSPDDVKVRMMNTADPIAGVSRFQQGAGLLDAAGALASGSTPTGMHFQRMSVMERQSLPRTTTPTGTSKRGASTDGRSSAGRSSAGRSSAGPSSGGPSSAGPTSSRPSSAGRTWPGPSSGGPSSAGRRTSSGPSSGGRS